MISEDDKEAITKLSTTLGYFSNALVLQGISIDEGRGKLVHLFMAYLLDDGFFISNVNYETDNGDEEHSDLDS